MSTSSRIRDPRLRRLLNALPRRVRRAYTRLTRPGAKWLRVPLGVALIAGGAFSFLPILGLWMLPLGALLLSEDIPPLRRITLSALGKAQSCWDAWRPR